MADYIFDYNKKKRAQLTFSLQLLKITNRVQSVAASHVYKCFSGTRLFTGV